VSHEPQLLDNLNISQYVSTAIDEEIIDLKEVHDKLMDIEKKAADARERHNEFLRELGLEGM
jgi:type I restriction enzyme M protein